MVKINSQKKTSSNISLKNQKAYPIKNYFSQEELKLFYLLTEHSLDGIFTINLDGNITYLNKVAEHMIKIPTGRKPAHFLDYVEKTYVSKAKESFCKVKQGEPLKRCELKIIDKKHRTSLVECTAFPIFKEGEIVQILIIVRDIDKRKQRDHLVNESGKMHALHNFIEGTASEIQHPLKGLLDQAQKLLDTYKNRHFEYIGFKEFTNIMETLSIMRDQIKYCCDTTDRILSLHRQKARLKTDCCNANTCIREVVKLIAHQKEIFDVKFELKLARNLPLVAINIVEFKQVVTNIVTNAVQSIVSDGRICLKTNYLKKEKRVLIECIDNGIGIPKENLAHVLDPFFTTKHRGLEKSSGLGLAIVNSVVKAFGGKIVIKSNLRQGTTVRILLPVKHDG